MKTNKYIEEFLIKNGFKTSKLGWFVNTYCRIRIVDNKYYEVKINNNLTDNEESGSMFSNDLNIYWLIGVLTYNELINKNYKK
jgi:hypothetical protein